MTDNEARQYIDHLARHEYLEAEALAGTVFSETKAAQYQQDAFETYGHYAAELAREWCDKNFGQNEQGLGRCLHAANVGLMLAASLYRERKRKVAFRFYAKPIIISELEKLK